jgi:phospholipid transport system substrate-binding protein
MRSLLLAMLCVAAACLLPGRASAASDPQGFVNELGGKVLAIIKTPDLSVRERQKRFRDLFTQAFDAPAIGRFVLSREWSKLSDEQRKQYLDLFSDYIAAIYAIQFSGYQGQTFKTLGVNKVAQGDSNVRCEIDRPGGQPPIRLTFRVRQENGFKIVDVHVEGVSLILTKRDEFASVLGREGFDGVIKRMRKVVDESRQAKS